MSAITSSSLPSSPPSSARRVDPASRRPHRVGIAGTVAAATVTTAAALAAVVGAPLGAQATPPGLAGTARVAAAPAPAAARRLPGVACPREPAVVRPTHVPISCGDGSAYVIHVRWTSLTPTRGTAKGIVLINDCVPTCAAGHFTSYGSRLTFTGVRRRHGGPVFTRLLVRFTTRHPAGHRTIVATY